LLTSVSPEFEEPSIGLAKRPRIYIGLRQLRQASLPAGLGKRARRARSLHGHSEEESCLHDIRHTEFLRINMQIYSEVQPAVLLYEQFPAHKSFSKANFTSL
jgi:hypothetical protein